MDRNVNGAVKKGQVYVALRKESVDRNDAIAVQAAGSSGRSPQGERG